MSSWWKGTPAGNALDTGAADSYGIHVSSVVVPGWRAMRSERIQGHEWGT